MSNVGVLMSKSRTNPYLRAALESVPDYVSAVALRANALAAQSSLVAVQPPPQPTDPDADLERWLSGVAEAATARLIFEAQRGALADLLRDCDFRIVGTPVSHSAALLGSLADDMARLMADVGGVVARLDGARTPAEAIEGGTADTWRALSAIRESYDAIREAQATITLAADTSAFERAASQYIDDPLASDLALANLDDILPGWRQPDTSHISISGTPPERRPWPTNDPLAQLVWLSTSAAKVWVPTLGDLEALRERRQAQANPTPVVVPGRHDRVVNKPLSKAAR